MIKEENKKIYNLIIIFISFFIFVFFTTSFYSTLNENLEINNKYKKELQEKKDKLAYLNSIKNKFISNKDKEIKKIKKLNQDFSEDKVFLYINEYLETLNRQYWEVVAKLTNVTFSNKEKTEIWLNQVKINLELKYIKDTNVLIDILNYLTNTNNKYSFLITDLQFPIEKSWNYSVSIPLIMYVK